MSCYIIDEERCDIIFNKPMMYPNKKAPGIIALLMLSYG